MKLPLDSIVKEKWYILPLLAILLVSFIISAVPARYNELQALDPFFFYRAGETLLQNNMQLPDIDFMREHPIGKQGWDFTVSMYFPPLMYILLFAWTGMSWFNFALIFPALMAPLAGLVMFFIGKELKGNITGLFSSFFLVTSTAFLPRMSAGFIEKEPMSSFLILLIVLFFIKSFKAEKFNPALIYSSVAGIALGLMSALWRGILSVQVMIALFVFIVMLFDVVQKKSDNSKKIFIAYAPMILIGFIVSKLFPLPINLLAETSILVTYAVLVLLGIRVFVERFRLVEEKHLSFVVPGLIIIGLFGFFASSIFFDYAGNKFDDLTRLIQGKKTSQTHVTVAENQPGDWGAIQSGTIPAYANSIVPELSFLSPYLSVWNFMYLAIIFLAYEFYKKRNVLLLLPIIWLILGFQGVFSFIRLLILFSFPAALMAGYFMENFIDFLRSLSSRLKALKDINAVPLVLVFLVSAIFFINVANAYAFTINLGPSICIRNSGILIDGQKCLETDSNGNIVKYAEGQPWYEAMTFLRENTPENSNIISWWDFGYWFQTRGKRPTVSDGGYGPRLETARWFVAQADKWEEFKPWLIDTYGVDYILMDYTLPGKYGAITAIASDGRDIRGYLQFEGPTNTFNQDNITVIEFKAAGQNTLWIPMQNNAIASSPVFFQSVGDQVVGRAYVNELCTENGIIKVGNSTPDLAGCLFLKNNRGVFYIPDEIKNDIFTRLMFMDGAGLPVEKVFDNNLIQIYSLGQN